MTALNNYFKGTACKYLSAVDTSPSKSNQHEIGSNKFTAILGVPGTDKIKFNATFLFFKADAEEPETCTDVVTYYDTRVGQPHRSSEYRLYYRSNVITELMSAGDFCLISLRTNGELLIAIAPQGSADERRLRYLFNAENAQQQWVVGTEVDSRELDLASRSILSAIGIETAEPIENLLGAIIDKFGLVFPKTVVFSEFARSTMVNQINAADQPDRALEEWMKQEERLFRTLEREIVGTRIKKGFDSVESFIAFSLSVQNRRKSRVGHALENHLESVFMASAVRYQRGAKTEGNSKPDFLFPGAKEYHDSSINSPPLRMLAAKSTCKDRWRQILAEATRIPQKHLFTLETAISESQTTEMASHSVQLVVPPSIAKTFSVQQQRQLINLKEFVGLLER
jgi:EcoRII C terminal